MEYIDKNIDDWRNNLWLEQSRSDIFDNISKNIDVQKFIDDWILKISDDVKKYIDSIWYTIEDVLMLAGVYKKFRDLKSIKFEKKDSWLYVKTDGRLYSFTNNINFDNLVVDFEKSNTSLSNFVSAFKILSNQVLFLRNKWFSNMVCYAGCEKNLAWYYYRPMLWFRAAPDINILEITKKSANPEIIKCKTLNQLFDLKDKNWNYIGIDFWKKYGFWFDAEFDLNDNSKSIARLNEYIFSKKQSNPEKYSDIDVIK